MTCGDASFMGFNALVFHCHAHRMGRFPLHNKRKRYIRVIDRLK